MPEIQPKTSFMSKEETKKTDLFPGNMAIWFLWAASMFTFLAALAYIYWFGSVKGYHVGEPEAWALFGDYFGGLLGPVLSLFALIILAITLRANMFALRQNEFILVLSRKELKATRKQIEQNNAALAKQIETMQGNAHVERLGMYAEKVYQEILEIRAKPIKEKFLIFRHDDGALSLRNVFAAFDSLGKEFNNMLRADDGESPWDDTRPDSDLVRVVRLLEELMVTCTSAATISRTHEMIEYYDGRLGRWIDGACQLGYIDTENHKFYQNVLK